MNAQLGSHNAYLQSLFTIAVHQDASDIHLHADQQPMLRVRGRLKKMANLKSVNDSLLIKIANNILDSKQKEQLRNERFVDSEITFGDLGALHINTFKEGQHIAMTQRIIRNNVPKLSSLGIPRGFCRLLKEDSGLILVSGDKSSDKQTTMAAMVDQINRSMEKHIVTLENPLYFKLKNKKSIISQRDLEAEGHSAAAALESTLALDPDVIMISEINSQEDLQACIQAVSAGHLVIAGVTSNNTAETVAKMLNFYQGDELASIKQNLANHLLGVIGQRFVPAKDSDDDILVTEYLLSNTKLARVINNFESQSDLVKYVEDAKNNAGTLSFDSHLVMLWEEDKISSSNALRNATNAKTMRMRLQGVSI